MPLFHQPNFYKRYEVHGARLNRYQHLRLEDSLIVAGVCALAARFSTSSYFADTAPKSRAEPFLRHATQLYQDALRSESNAPPPSLDLLQGLLLLAWFHQVCGSSGRCWMLVGVCCRMALDLGLDTTDRDIVEGKTGGSGGSSGPAQEWSKREERRRAWWVLWQLDMFSSTVLHRPHTLDKTQIDVLLPVCDTHWFSNSPVASVPVLTDPIQVWKSLKDSPNQSPRAWLIVSIFLRAVAHDLTRTREAKAQVISDFQSSLTCFLMILPKEFDLRENVTHLDEGNLLAYNFVITTHLMVMSMSAFLRPWCRRRFPELVDMSPDSATLHDERLFCRLVRQWDPKYMARVCPLICANLLGPSAVHAKAACDMAGDLERSRPIYLELLKLVLGKIGCFWELGSSSLDLVQVLESRRSIHELVNPVENDLHRLPLLLPNVDSNR